MRFLLKNFRAGFVDLLAVAIFVIVSAIVAVPVTYVINNTSTENRSQAATEGCDNGVAVNGTACQSQGDSVQYRCLAGSHPGSSNWNPESCNGGTCQGSSCSGGGGGGGGGGSNPQQPQQPTDKSGTCSQSSVTAVSCRGRAVNGPCNGADGVCQKGTGAPDAGGSPQCGCVLNTATCVQNGLPLTAGKSCCSGNKYTIPGGIMLCGQAGGSEKTFLTNCDVSCSDTDGCTCLNTCVLSETANTRSCGGVRQALQTPTLTDCGTCASDGGCVCPETCKKTGNINEYDSCGGYKLIEKFRLSSCGDTCNMPNGCVCLNDCQNAGEITNTQNCGKKKLTASCSNDGECGSGYCNYNHICEVKPAKKLSCNETCIQSETSPCADGLTCILVNANTYKCRLLANYTSITCSASIPPTTATPSPKPLESCTVQCDTIYKCKCANNCFKSNQFITIGDSCEKKANTSECTGDSECQSGYCKPQEYGTVKRCAERSSPNTCPTGKICTCNGKTIYAGAICAQTSTYSVLANCQSSGTVSSINICCEAKGWTDSAGTNFCGEKPQNCGPSNWICRSKCASSDDEKEFKDLWQNGETAWLFEAGCDRYGSTLKPGENCQGNQTKCPSGYRCAGSPMTCELPSIPLTCTDKCPNYATNGCTCPENCNNPGDIEAGVNCGGLKSSTCPHDKYCTCANKTIFAGDTCPAEQTLTPHNCQESGRTTNPGYCCGKNYWEKEGQIFCGDNQSIYETICPTGKVCGCTGGSSSATDTVQITQGESCPEDKHIVGKSDCQKSGETLREGFCCRESGHWTDEKGSVFCGTKKPTDNDQNSQPILPTFTKNIENLLSPVKNGAQNLLCAEPLKLLFPTLCKKTTSSEPTQKPREPSCPNPFYRTSASNCKNSELTVVATYANGDVCCKSQLISNNNEQVIDSFCYRKNLAECDLDSQCKKIGDKCVGITTVNIMKNSGCQFPDTLTTTELCTNIGSVIQQYSNNIVCCKKGQSTASSLKIVCQRPNICISANDCQTYSGTTVIGFCADVNGKSTDVCCSLPQSTTPKCLDGEICVCKTSGGSPRQISTGFSCGTGETLFMSLPIEDGQLLGDRDMFYCRSQKSHKSDKQEILCGPSSTSLLPMKNGCTDIYSKQSCSAHILCTWKNESCKPIYCAIPFLCNTVSQNQSNTPQQCPGNKVCECKNSANPDSKKIILSDSLDRKCNLVSDEISIKDPSTTCLQNNGMSFQVGQRTCDRNGDSYEIACNETGQASKIDCKENEVCKMTLGCQPIPPIQAIESPYKCLYIKNSSSCLSDPDCQWNTFGMNCAPKQVPAHGLGAQPPTTSPCVYPSTCTSGNECLANGGAVTIASCFSSGKSTGVCCQFPTSSSTSLTCPVGRSCTCGDLKTSIGSGQQCKPGEKMSVVPKTNTSTIGFQQSCSPGKCIAPVGSPLVWGMDCTVVQKTSCIWGAANSKMSIETVDTLPPSDTSSSIQRSIDKSLDIVCSSLRTLGETECPTKDSICIATGKDVDAYLEKDRKGSSATTLHSAQCTKNSENYYNTIGISSSVTDESVLTLAIIEELVQEKVWSNLTQAGYSQKDIQGNTNTRAFGEYLQHAAIRQANGSWLGNTYSINFNHTTVLNEGNKNSGLPEVSSAVATYLQGKNITVGNGVLISDANVVTILTNPTYLSQINEQLGFPISDLFGMKRNSTGLTIPPTIH